VTVQNRRTYIHTHSFFVFFFFIYWCRTNKEVSYNSIYIIFLFFYFSSLYLINNVLSYLIRIDKKRKRTEYYEIKNLIRYKIKFSKLTKWCMHVFFSFLFFSHHFWLTQLSSFLCRDVYSLFNYFAITFVFRQFNQLN